MLIFFFIDNELLQGKPWSSSGNNEIHEEYDNYNSSNNNYTSIDSYSSNKTIIDLVTNYAESIVGCLAPD